MPTCRFVNQDGMRCSLAVGHQFQHVGEGVVMTPDRNLWTELPVPVFSIKASDPFAGACIQLWIVLAASFMYKGPDAPCVPREKVRWAQQRLDEFLTYQKNYGTKLPD